MNTRLKQFLLAENITQTQFAETIGVAPASVSHILGGRNKPGYDFLLNISRHYPALNLEWLITGKGKMYNQVSKNAVYEQSLLQEIDDAPSDTEESSPRESRIPESLPAGTRIFESRLNREHPTPAAAASYSPAKTPSEANQSPASHSRTINKIVIFYTDGTFVEIS